MIRQEDLIAKFQYALDEHWGYIWGTAGILWTQARQNASSREQTVKYGSRWIGHTVADCSGLFRWAYKQLGSDIAHGSNSIFDRYCSETGELKSGFRTDGLPLRPGTAVFTGTKGDHGHIGLYIGKDENGIGWVIEAKGTQYGVVKSKVTESKWTWWGELKIVVYSPENGANSPSVDKGDNSIDYTHRTLRRGDKGDSVRDLQLLLVKRGYSLPKYGIDGDYGAETERAVKAFQKDHGLAQDGVCGPKTWAALTETLFIIHIPNLTMAQVQSLEKKYPSAWTTVGDENA